ncbi:MAG: hypothetical protein EBR67_03705 [Proteobacteria bacterium]|nr:hypothetical protein [Pseudomonadota bacterium]
MVLRSTKKNTISYSRPADRKETSIGINTKNYSNEKPVTQASRTEISLLSKSSLPDTVLSKTASVINQTGKLVGNSGANLSKFTSRFITNPENSGRRTLISYVPLALNLLSIPKYIGALKGFMEGNARQSVADFISGLILNSVASDSKKLALTDSSVIAKSLLPTSLVKLTGLGVMELSKQLDNGSGRLTKLAGSESMNWGINSLFTEILGPVQGILKTALFGHAKASAPVDASFPLDEQSSGIKPATV